MGARVLFDNLMGRFRTARVTLTFPLETELAIRGRRKIESGVLFPDLDKIPNPLDGIRSILVLRTHPVQNLQFTRIFANFCISAKTAWPVSPWASRLDKTFRQFLTWVPAVVRVLLEGLPNTHPSRKALRQASSPLLQRVASESVTNRWR